MSGNEAKLIEKYTFEPVGTQLEVFIISILAGVAIILIYTGYSALIAKIFKNRRSLKRRLSFAVTDIRFWISAAVVMFFIYYRINNAIIRPYCFIFIFLGMLIAYNVKLLILRRYHIPEKCINNKEKDCK